MVRMERRLCAVCGKAVEMEVRKMNWILHAVLFVVLGLVLGPFTLWIPFALWLIVFVIVLAVHASKPVNSPKCRTTL